MRNVLILAFTALLTIPAIAYTSVAAAENPPSIPNVANTPDEAQKTPGGKFVQDLGDKAIAEIADKSVSKEERAEKYRELLSNSFDMKAIGHFVIGRAWDQASDQQKQEFLNLFEKVVLKTYGDRLNLYSGEGFRVKSVRPESDKDSIVTSEITHADGSKPARVDWRVRQKDGRMAVVDVVVEGVSQSVTQRDEYSSIIHRDGGKLDGLLDLMRKQTQDAPNQANQ